MVLSSYFLHVVYLFQQNLFFVPFYLTRESSVQAACSVGSCYSIASEGVALHQHNVMNPKMRLIKSRQEMLVLAFEEVGKGVLGSH